MNWIKFKDGLSTDIGVIVEKLIPVPSPQLKSTAFEIPGKDGDFETSDDSYKPISYAVPLGISEKTAAAEIATWLRGSGELVLSSISNFKYYARVANIEYEWVSRRLRRAVANFILQPFKYERNPKPITLTASKTIYHPGTRFSLPTIKVYGAGTVTVGGYELTVAAAAGENFVIINSEIQECYYDLSTPRNDKVSGEFPRIDPGPCAVTLGSGITRVDIDGNWRWF